MKSAKAFLLLFVLGACAFLSYRAWQLDQDSGPEKSRLHNAAQCDQGLWDHIYHPYRLQVLDACVSVTGTVEEIRKEADGDYHALFRLDKEFASLLNEKNLSSQQGDLVLEFICQDKVRQADALDSCSGYQGPFFEIEIGQRYQASGTYVYDAGHGWNELHPVNSLRPLK